MPYSIFFDGGYAIHGSYEISHLGRPASHGCIRLHPDNAAILFGLVKANMDDTRIVVTGERPEREERSERVRHHHSEHASRDRGERREPASRHRKTRRARRDFDDVLNDAPDEDTGHYFAAGGTGSSPVSWPGSSRQKPTLRRSLFFAAPGYGRLSLFPLPQKEGMERREARGRLAQRPLAGFGEARRAPTASPCYPGVDRLRARAPPMTEGAAPPGAPPQTSLRSAQT